MSWALAILVVAMGGAGVVVAAVAAASWARWMRRTGGVVGTIGLVLTGGALVNLGVPRTCEHGTAGERRDRPVAAVFVGGRECRADAAGQLQLVVLVGLAVTSAVLWRSRATPGGQAERTVSS